MLDLTREQDGRFVIFSVSPLRYGEVANVVNLLPHKWLVGHYAGKDELSCLLPLNDFVKREVFLMEDQESFLVLGKVNHRDGSRPADLVYPKSSDKLRVHLKPFRQVRSVKKGDDFSFDPEAGAYYATPDERTVIPK